MCPNDFYYEKTSYLNLLEEKCVDPPAGKAREFDRLNYSLSLHSLECIIL
jgi:hypothetical protein